MNKVLKKTVDLLTKMLDRAPTPKEIEKFLNGAGILQVNEILKEEDKKHETFDSH